jgi:hypothetical protein
MAAKGQKPVLANPMLARAAFEHDLIVVLGGRRVTWGESGWTRLDELTLLIPLTGYRNQVADGPAFLLKLDFRHYPEWPPGAQFVNPTTNTYTFPADRFWLPRLESDEIRTHENHPNIGQLICSSVTREFYEILHDVDDKYVWKHPKQTFAATLNTIEGALTECYNGRFSPKPS